MGLGYLRNRKELVTYAARRGAPAAALAVPLAGLMLVLGAVSVSLGIYASVGLILWVVFLVLSALIVHLPRPSDDGQERTSEMVHFMKDMTLAGLALTLLPSAQQAWPLALNIGVYSP